MGHNGTCSGPIGLRNEVPWDVMDNRRLGNTGQLSVLGTR